MQRRSDTDRYGDGDVPEVDYKPYEKNSYHNNHFEPHPQASGENRSDEAETDEDADESDQNYTL